MNNLQEIPHNQEAERAVLGSLLIDRDAIIKVASLLKPTDFHDQAHAWIYAAMLDLYDRIEPSDLVTLAHELKLKGRLEEVGGAAYLVALPAEVPVAVHVEYYAKQVAELATLRRLIAVGGRIAGLGYAGEPSEQLLSSAQRLLDEVGGSSKESIWQEPGAVLSTLFDRMSLGGDEGDLGLRTGYCDLDAILHGLRRKEVYIVAARPGLGKTALAGCIALDVARRGKRVAFASLEMSAEMLMLRLLAQASGLAAHDIETGRVVGGERLATAFGELASLPLHIADLSSMRPGQLRAEARKLVAEIGTIDMLVIDYVQIMEADQPSRSATEEVTAISKAIKRLAKELDIPILLLAQLNRAVEGRGDHKPTLADLRQSGQLEQDAAGVILLYRNEDEPDVINLLVAKHRHGATGEVQLCFDGATMRFSNMARRDL